MASVTDRHSGTPHPDHHALAAFHLYELVKPADGCEFSDLTSEQRARYRALIRIARRSTDVTAIRAAFERAAGALAIHDGKTLRSLTPAARRDVRYDAMDAVRAYELSLADGDEVSDALVLSLQLEERHARDASEELLREVGIRG